MTIALISGCFALGGVLLTNLVLWSLERLRRTAQRHQWLQDKRYEAYVDLLNASTEIMRARPLTGEEQSTP
jgi:hypothetical protein